MVPITSIYMLPVTSLWIFLFLFSNYFASICTIPIFQWRQYVWFQFTYKYARVHWTEHFNMIRTCTVDFTRMLHTMKNYKWNYSRWDTYWRHWKIGIVHIDVIDWLQVGVLNTAFVHKSLIKSAVRLAY
jgi:hypothetical protein